MKKFLSNVNDIFEVMYEGAILRIWIIGLAVAILIVGLISPKYALDRLENFN